LLLIIFGAGASYDSSADVKSEDSNPPVHLRELLQYRPPLADQLFDNRPLFARVMADFPQCQAIVTRLRHRPSDQSVEQMLAALEGETGEHPVRRAQLLAVRFYLRQAITLCQADWKRLTQGVTNYQTLLDVSARWRSRYGHVGLVTFNYDNMLEQALGGRRPFDCNTR